MSTENKKKQENKTNGNLLSALPANTPSLAVAIAVVMFVAVSLYPVIRNEVELLLKFRQTVAEGELDLQDKKLVIKSELDSTGLQALADLATENNKALIEQAEKIGILMEKISRLEINLTSCELKLQACLGK